MILSAEWKRRQIVHLERVRWRLTNCKLELQPVKMGIGDLKLIQPRFKAKFKSFVDQYEMRELHFYSLLRTKELEVQYNQARYEQQRKQAEAESLRAKALNSQVSTFSQTEAELRSQLNIYVEKFKQVSHAACYPTNA